MEDAADLSRLADIVVPPAVPWWPPAPGWWIVATALLAGLLILCVALHRLWRRNAYRRAALAELDALAVSGQDMGFGTVSAILKRTALVAYPREEVASLTGRAWRVFLDRSADGSTFAALPDRPGMASADRTTLLAAARHWVTHHRGEG